MQCSVCSHQVGTETKKTFLLGRISLEEAASRVETTPSNFWHCIRNHPLQANVHFSLKEMIEALVRKLYTRLEEFLALPIDTSRPEYSIAQLTKECRSLIELLARIEGLVKSQPIVEQHVNVVVTKFQSLVTSKLCDKCKREALLFFEELEQLK